MVDEHRQVHRLRQQPRETVTRTAEAARRSPASCGCGTSAASSSSTSLTGVESNRDLAAPPGRIMGRTGQHRSPGHLLASADDPQAHGHRADRGVLESCRTVPDAASSRRTVGDPQVLQRRRRVPQLRAFLPLPLRGAATNREKQQEQEQRGQQPSRDTAGRGKADKKPQSKQDKAEAERAEQTRTAWPTSPPRQ